ncbi:endonuclease V [Haloarcula sp. JP-L23]|uniref:endonuclease V n=1 Tax=Haloarcula sp. JP-L23 TaxID=2716717 RepID=UPI00140F0EC2|nr:endonuclease V [Haloarcula sp. JP-L23]
MDVLRPEFVPDPSLSTAEMETLQRDIARAAVFEDDHAVDPESVAIDGPVGQSTLGEAGDGPVDEPDADRPLVAGVDQAFVGDRAVSAVVVLRGRAVVERVYAVEPTEIPYVPGLLSFREGGAILSAFAELDHDPDIVFVDGSGRIHYREAGLATHVGVTLDVPTVGVAKNLLCGTPRESLDRKLPEGARVPIDADDEVETAENGVCIGYAVQTRQYESDTQYVNPLLVSPGHRVSAETAADLVLATAAGYKLPEPTRLADTYADEVKTDV